MKMMERKLAVVTIIVFAPNELLLIDTLFNRVILLNNC